MRTALMWKYVDWIDEKLEVKTMVTLTFRNPMITEEKAWGLFKYWIHQINIEVEGSKYKREWKHSYFSYIVAAELQKRGTIHYHVLIDNWFPWGFASKLWWDLGGFSKIQKIKNPKAAVRYTMKYVLKSGNEPVVWLARKRWNKIGMVVNLDELFQAEMDKPYVNKGRYDELGR